MKEQFSAGTEFKYEVQFALSLESVSKLNDKRMCDIFL